MRRSGRKRALSSRPDAEAVRGKGSRRFERSLERLVSEDNSLPSPSELDPSDFAAYRALTDSPASPPRAPISSDEGERLRQENRNLKRLQEIVHFLGNTTDLDQLVPEVVGLGVSISSLSRGLLALLGSKSAEGERAFTVRVVRGITRDERSSPEVRFLRKVLAKTLEERRPFFEFDAPRLAESWGEPHARDLQLGAIVALPLEAKLTQASTGEELVGALLLDDPSRKTPFTPHEIELLRNFARHASTALARLGDRKRLSKRTSRLREEREKLREEQKELQRHLSETQHELVALKTRSGRIAAASSRLAAVNGGREPDRLDEYLGRTWDSAKKSFLKRYLKEAMRRSHNDLQKAAQSTGLSVAKLVKLLELHEVEPSRSPAREAR